MANERSWSAFFYGIAGTVTAGIILWGVTSIFPGVWSRLVTPPIPPDAIMAFTAQKCPVGWEKFQDAEGRFILGWSEDNSLPSQETRALRPFRDLGGEPTVILTQEQMPTHSHGTITVLRTARAEDESYQVVGSGKEKLMLNGQGTEPRGSYMPHNNMPPYIALTFCKKV